MYPDRKTALIILKEGVFHNPGKWYEHSLCCGHCAEAIASRCSMDAEKAYVLGLLHDIGRRFGARHLGHVADGYRYMMSLGYDEAARICLSHSFNGKDLYAYVGKFDTDAEETALIREKLEEEVFDDYDMLIQLCDAMAGTDGVMDIEERMSDVRRRYGDYDPRKWELNLGLKSYFEDKIGMSIYEAADKDHYVVSVNDSDDLVCVTGHRNPDSDSICSAVAFSDLLNMIGIGAKVLVEDGIGRESAFILRSLEQAIPDFIESPDGRKVILVDHSSRSQMPEGIGEEDVIGIVDHHPDGDIRKQDLLFHAIADCGASASLVYDLFERYGIVPDRKDAGLLMAGILSDTRNMTSSVRKEDIQAFEQLKNLSGIREIGMFYENMRKACLDHDGMSDDEIFRSDFKEYVCEGIRFGFSCIVVSSEEEMETYALRFPDLMKRMLKDGRNDLLFLKIKNEEEGDMILLAEGQMAEEILSSCFEEAEGRSVHLNKSRSRKRVLVPLIEDVLRKR